MQFDKNVLICILGPTAIGKTALAVRLARTIDAEIISADSRQVYREMDIGTGKDLKEYYLNGKLIPSHLIDILEAGAEYNVFDFQKDFYKSFNGITEKGKTALLCGGSGMYLDAALSENKMYEVPTNISLRKKLSRFNLEELQLELKRIKPNLHNTTDLTDTERCIRAIEIETYKLEEKVVLEKSPVSRKVVFGLQLERELLRERIAKRLKHRLENGMIEEVGSLLKKGISAEKLNYYGLEYRYISKYLIGDITYSEMESSLLQAIRRFAKKQMTWFRRMEKKGTKIHWIDAQLDNDKKIELIKEIYNNEF